jgi:hypothetical protein
MFSWLKPEGVREGQRLGLIVNTLRRDHVAFLKYI